MTGAFALALAQVDPKVGDVAGNVALVRKARAASAAAGADLVLLPELLALQNGEQQLQALGSAMASFSAAIEALQTTIRDRRSAMQAALTAFVALC